MLPEVYPGHPVHVDDDDGGVGGLGHGHGVDLRGQEVGRLKEQWPVHRDGDVRMVGDVGLEGATRCRI